jgi:hypothetical protein
MRRHARNFVILSAALAWIGFAGQIMEFGGNAAWYAWNYQNLKLHFIYPASAQSCNDPSGFLKSYGTFNIGDMAVFGPGCQQIMDGGVSGISVTTPTIATLKALAPPSGTTSLFVTGYYAAGDGGAGWFYWNSSSSAADNAGTIIDPVSAPATGRWFRNIPIPGEASVKWFGAKGDNATDDNNAIAATVTWLGNDSKLIFPSGTYLCSNTCLNYVGGAGIEISGTSAANSAFPQNVIVIYTGSIARPLLSFDGTEGINVHNISLRYNNASYAGDLVDLRKRTSGSLTASFHLHDFNLSGVYLTADSANSLLRMGGTLKVSIEHGFVQDAVRGVENSGLEGAVSDVDIFDVWFQNISLAPITTAGNNWTIRGNPVEPLLSTVNAGFIVGSGPCYGCLITGNNIGDATGTGTWIDLTSGAFIGGGITYNAIDETHQNIASVSVKLGASVATLVEGNAFFIPTGGTGPINAASAVGPKIGPNNCYVTNSSTTPCSILNGAAPSGEYSYLNNDGTGYHMSALLLGTPLSAANGGVDTTAWSSYSPSVTTTAGTVTINSATYKTSGKTVYFNVVFTISAFGSGNNFTFLLPVTPLTDGAVTGSNNSGVLGYLTSVGNYSAGSTTVNVLNAGGGSSIQNNGKYSVWGTYQSN